jgi:hypothetical protein
MGHKGRKTNDFGSKELAKFGVGIEVFGVNGQQTSAATVVEGSQSLSSITVLGRIEQT